MAEGKQICRGCEKAAAKIENLEMRLKQLEDELAKAKKNSANSSKPLSSDIVDPKQKNDTKNSKKSGKKRTIGQPGRGRHQRKPFTDDQIDTSWELRFRDCPCCGGKLEDDPTLEPSVITVRRGNPLAQRSRQLYLGIQLKFERGRNSRVRW